MLWANEGSLCAKQVKWPHNASKSYERATKMAHIYYQEKEERQRKAKQQEYKHAKGEIIKKGD